MIRTPVVHTIVDIVDLIFATLDYLYTCNCNHFTIIC